MMVGNPGNPQALGGQIDLLHDSLGAEIHRGQQRLQLAQPLRLAPRRFVFRSK